MNSSRRVLLSTAIRLLGLGGAFLLGPVRALGQWGARGWSVRRATGADAASLPEIFSTHLEAGLCPYGDRIEPWTVEKAVEFLEGHNGTLILERNGVPVGFAGLVDYSDPSRAEWVAVDAEAEISVFALAFDRLEASEALSAVKVLGAAVGRELQRMGFTHCRARIRTQPMFDSWYEGHMEVSGIREREGVEHARERSASTFPEV